MVASLDLEFAFDPRKHVTAFRRTRQQPPLRVIRAFTLSDGAALVHLHNVSGGLLGGDELHVNVDVGEGASAQLTTTSATRVYRAANPDMECVQRNTVAVEEGALLEYLPDPIIPFAGARLRQHTTIRLAAGAGLFWWEVLSPGREARGEIFAYDSVRMKTEVSALAVPIAIENIQLEPRTRDLASPARLGPYRYWTTFYICRVGEDPNRWTALEQQLRELSGGLAAAGDARWAVSTLPNSGVVVRGLTVHGRDALAGLHEMWRAAKFALFGRAAVPPRKIH